MTTLYDIMIGIGATYRFLGWSIMIAILVILWPLTGLLVAAEAGRAIRAGRPVNPGNLPAFLVSLLLWAAAASSLYLTT